MPEERIWTRHTEPPTERPAGPPAGPPAGAPSFLDELRQEFAKPVKERRHFEQLPAVGGRLYAEYKPLDLQSVLAVQAEEPSVEVVQDFLIRAVVDVHVLDPEHPEANASGYLPLARKAGVDVGGPLAFDRRLAELVGVEPGPAREILMRLFEGDEIWLVMHFTNVTDWMASTQQGQLEDFARGS